MVAFFLLDFPDEVADVEVIDAEVVAPCGEAMRLVDDETHHIAGKEQLLKGFGTKHLRCDIEYGGTAVGDPFESVRTRDGILKPVDGDRFGDPFVRKIIDLVLHQRLQRRDDHREPVLVPSRHDGWKLEGQ